MNKMPKIFIGIIFIIALFPIPAEMMKADEIKTEPTVEMTESKNIIEMESNKFVNLTSSNKTLTVYKVYEHKILVVEGENGEIEVIELKN